MQTVMVNEDDLLRSVVGGVEGSLRDSTEREGMWSREKVLGWAMDAVSSASNSSARPLPSRDDLLTLFNITDEEISYLYGLYNATPPTPPPTPTSPQSRDACYCGGWARDMADAYRRAHGYISLAVCVFGTVANLLNVAVLTRSDMAKAPINRLLTWLAIADILVMVEYVPFACYTYLVLPERVDFPYSWAVFILFHGHFSQIMHTISICLTQALAVWKYIAIRLLAFHLEEPGSIPGRVAPKFSHMKIVLDAAAGRRAFSGISRFPHPTPHSPHCIPIGSQDLDAGPIRTRHSRGAITIEILEWRVCKGEGIRITLRKPLASSNILYVSHLRRYGQDPAGNRARLIIVEGRFPHENAVLCSDARCRLAILVSYTLPVLVCSPSFFVFEVRETRVVEGGEVVLLYHVALSRLARRADQLLYTANFWTYSVVVKLLPCCILAYLSCWLVAALHSFNKRKLQRNSEYNPPPPPPITTPHLRHAVRKAVHDKASTQQRRNTRANPPTSSIVQYDFHVQKSGSDSTGNRIRYMLAGGERVVDERSSGLRCVCGVTESSDATGPEPCSPERLQLYKSEMRSHRTIRMLVAVMLLFLLTELPQGVLGLLSGILGRCFFHNCYHRFGELMDILALLNGAINFLLYCLMSRQFRAAFRQLFRPRGRVLVKWVPVSQTEVHISPPLKSIVVCRFDRYHRASVIDTAPAFQVDCRMSRGSIPQSPSLALLPPFKSIVVSPSLKSIVVCHVDRYHRASVTDTAPAFQVDCRMSRGSIPQCLRHWHCPRLSSRLSYVARVDRYHGASITDAAPSLKLIVVYHVDRYHSAYVTGTAPASQVDYHEFRTLGTIPHSYKMSERRSRDGVRTTPI
ncbi:hypothetical protein PR048_015097 [Dryococelus australis]|uniref:G-protein coupled receptors family 1 profile domain-containing protein n=1 Tax=Dryococelus australis TaxID=614101 RepID=A0ABQ9HGA0_9NEOP|nr:hypothetical protein PR048_015097 [Dryococelus australis]